MLKKNFNWEKKLNQTYQRFKFLFFLSNIYVLKLSLFGNNHIKIYTMSGITFISFLIFLKNSSLFFIEQVTDIYAKDLLVAPYRFSLLYSLLSAIYNFRLFLQIKITEVIFIPTISNLFFSCEWSERELWDMFGIFSIGNTDMRRLLTDYSFSGYPLRKTFPMTGYLEYYYETFFNTITSTPVELKQAYRLFF